MFKDFERRGNAIPIRISQKAVEDQARPGKLGVGTPGQTVSMNQLARMEDWINAITEFPPAPLFIKSLLFGQTENYWNDQVAVDFWRGSSTAAPFCTPYKRGIAIPRKRFVTSWVELPNISLVRDIRAIDLKFRQLGQSPTDTSPSGQIISDLQALDYQDLSDEITRREELMCCQVLTDGKLTIVDGEDLEPIMTIDFSPINEVAIDPGEYWDVPGTASDPLLHLELLRRHVTASGYPCNTFIFGADAASAFLRNQQVKESSNFLNFRRGVVDTRVYTDYENWGVNTIGEFSGMSLLSYEAMYEDAYDHKQHFYFPPDMILLASTSIQNRFAYGRVTQVEENNVIADYNLPRVPQYVHDALTNQLMFRLSSRPLPIPRNMASWCVAKVVTLRSKPIDIPVFETIQGRS